MWLQWEHPGAMPILVFIAIPPPFSIAAIGAFLESQMLGMSLYSRICWQMVSFLVVHLYAIWNFIQVLWLLQINLCMPALCCMFLQCWYLFGMTLGQASFYEKRQLEIWPIKNIKATRLWKQIVQSEAPAATRPRKRIVQFEASAFAAALSYIWLIAIRY